MLVEHTLNVWVNQTVTVRTGAGVAIGKLQLEELKCTYFVENEHAGGDNKVPRVEFLPEAVEKVTVEQPSPGVTDTVIELR